MQNFILVSRIKIHRLQVCFLILSLFFIKTIQAENIYALISRSKGMKEDTAKVGLQLKIIDLYILHGKYDSATTVINKVISLSEHLDYKNGKAYALCYKGIIQYNQSKYENSVSTLDSALNLFVSIDNAEGEIRSINNKAKAYGALDRYNEALTLLDQAEKKALDADDKKGLAHSYYLRGSILNDRGQYVDAGSSLQKSLELRMAIGDTAGLGASYSFLGLNYSYLGDYSKALDHIQKSIIIREKINDKRGLANSFLSQYKIFYVMKEWERALESELKSLALCSEIRDEQCVSGRYTNIGALYLRLGKYDEALDYHFKALEISRRIGIRNREGLVLNNIARTYLNLHRDKEAFLYIDSSLAIRKQLNDPEGIADSYLTMANVFYKQKSYQKSIDAALKAHEVAQSSGIISSVMEAYQVLSNNYLKQEDYKNAFLNYNKYINVRDSIYNIETSKELTKKQLNFEFSQQQQIQQLMQEKKDAEAEKKIREQKLIRNGLFIGLSLVAMILFLVFRALKRKKESNLFLNKINVTLTEQKFQLQRQHDQIEYQHKLIETKNREITDSIFYAKNIQTSLIPSTLDFEKYFEDSFILFKPKDIISGDFYWISDKEGKIIFVTADCTGHGVPGGFMSMLGISLLSEIINEYALTEPALVMSKLRKKVITSLKQKGVSGEHQDGMDLTLMVIDKKEQNLVYSAANHTFYIVRKNDKGDHELKQFKGDKQPVGIYGEKLKPFSQSEIQLQKGDLVYTFSDGFADQFGGPNGKKFKYKQLQSVLLKIADLPLSEQKQHLDKTLLSWQGSMEQVDDITVIGIRI
jgi:serine phosphatase RsbU (regulator of sigma subunit)